MTEQPYLFDLGFQTGAADAEPYPLTGSRVTEEHRRDFLAGWVLGQTCLARSKRLGRTAGDPGFFPPHQSRQADDPASG